MDKIISEGISGNDILAWIAIFFMFLMFCVQLYKTFFPGIKSGWERNKQLDQNDEDSDKRLAALESKYEELEKKVNRDFYKIQDLEAKSDKLERLIMDSLEEREILMRGMIAALDALHEMGGNGPTKAAKTLLEEYLTKRAHIV